jgi:uncharacterized protein with HEPN domain
MRSDNILTVLYDIRDNIDLARSFVAGYSFETFVHDRRTTYATTRCLEIISEASRRLPDEMKARHPHLPWPQIAAAGNVYRHDYEDVLEQIVWRTVHHGLDALLTMVVEEIQTRESE